MVGSVVVVGDEAIHLNSLFSAIGAEALPEGFSLSEMRRDRDIVITVYLVYALINPERF
jgi:hypothetical protein